MRERLDESFFPPQRGSISGAVALTAALELRAHGHAEAARDMLEWAIRWYRTRPPEEAATAIHRFRLARALCLTGQWDEAEGLLEGIAGDFRYTAIWRWRSPDSVSVKGLLGVLAARRGDRAEALRLSSELQRLERHPVSGLNVPTWQASIAALLEERERAVTLLRDAFAHGLVYGTWLHADPDFESLHDYPPYQELLRPKG